MFDYIVNFLSGQVPIVAYLAVALVMFFAGVYGFLTRKNLIMMLISIELMLNGADLNFVVFNRYLYPAQMEGMFFTIFAIAIAACETAVAIAIIINIYRNLNDIDVEKIDEMKY
jgi:NADH-quinone oxidoreductase subunit K